MFVKRYPHNTYPKNHSLYSETNRKVISKFKDELNGGIAFEFVDLMSKMVLSEISKNKKETTKRGLSTQIV